MPSSISLETLVLRVQTEAPGADEALIRYVQPLIRRMVQRYVGIGRQSRTADLQDLMQCASLGTYRAARSYDPRRGAFIPHLFHYVRWECRRLLGLTSRPRMEHYRSIPIGLPLTDPADEALLGRASTDTDDPCEEQLVRVELRRAVRQAVDTLPVREAQVIRRHDLQCLPMRAFASSMGLTPLQVRAVRNCALRRLQRNARLRSLHYDVFRHKGVRAFQSDWTSVVEAAVLHRAQDEMRT